MNFTIKGTGPRESCSLRTFQRLLHVLCLLLKRVLAGQPRRTVQVCLCRGKHCPLFQMFLKKEQGGMLHMYVVGYHTCQKLKERAKAVDSFILPSDQQ